MWILEMFGGLMLAILGFTVLKITVKTGTKVIRKGSRLGERKLNEWLKLDDWDD